MATGAERRDVLGMVLRSGLTLAAVGVLIGLGSAFVATRAARQLAGAGAG